MRLRTPRRVPEGASSGLQKPPIRLQTMQLPDLRRTVDSSSPEARSGPTASPTPLAGSPYITIVRDKGAVPSDGLAGSAPTLQPQDLSTHSIASSINREMPRIPTWGIQVLALLAASTLVLVAARCMAPRIPTFDPTGSGSKGGYAMPFLVTAIPPGSAMSSIPATSMSSTPTVGATDNNGRTGSDATSLAGSALSPLGSAAPNSVTKNDVSGLLPASSQSAGAPPEDTTQPLSHDAPNGFTSNQYPSTGYSTLLASRPPSEQLHPLPFPTPASLEAVPAIILPAAKLDGRIEPYRNE